MTIMSTSMHGRVDQAKPFLTDLNVLPGDHWLEHLRDGTPVLIRPLRAEDRGLEEDFLKRLSPEAKRLRFLGDFKEADPALVDRLMDVDFHDRMAFIALVHDEGKLREIGVSRYSATEDGQSCECAVTVAEDWQGRGLGVLLMRHLIGVARREGFRRMFSIDAANNQAMRDLADYLGFQRCLDPEDPCQVVHSISWR
jgi:GNAT superfamily N-acetyltransferase